MSSTIPAAATFTAPETGEEMVVTPATIQPCGTFAAMGFNSKLEANLQGSETFKTPWGIQQCAIPVALAGRDLIASAKSGSGKVAACVLPAVQRAMASKSTASTSEKGAGKALPSVLILAPTRELVNGIVEACECFSAGAGLRCVSLFGGSPVLAQLTDLNLGADIVVATPGRLADIFSRNKVSFANLQYLGLYETDRMVDMGFEASVRALLGGPATDMPGPGERQTVIYSCTMKPELMAFARSCLSDPTVLSVSTTTSPPVQVVHDVRWVDETDKHEMLLQVLLRDAADKQQVLVCVATKDTAKKTQDLLSSHDITAVALSGDQTNVQRNAVLEDFRSGTARVIVSTDVPLRGVQVPGVTLVIQYDTANDTQSYADRVARISAQGLAVSFVNSKSASVATDLVQVLDEAKQFVPTQLRELAAA